MFSPTVPLPQKRTRLDSRRFLYAQLPSPLLDAFRFIEYDSSQDDASWRNWDWEERDLWSLKRSRSTMMKRSWHFLTATSSSSTTTTTSWVTIKAKLAKKQWHIKCSIICKKQKIIVKNLLFTKKKICKKIDLTPQHCKLRLLFFLAHCGQWQFIWVLE